MRAVRALAARVGRGELQPRRDRPRTFERALDTADIPDPDLIVRTSGEQRISNFLLWQEVRGADLRARSLAGFW